MASAGNGDGYTGQSSSAQPQATPASSTKPAPTATTRPTKPPHSQTRDTMNNMGDDGPDGSDQPTPNPDHAQGPTPRAQGARDGNGKFIRSIETAELDARAARLRSQRKTYQQIADELGYADPTGARDAVLRALDAAPREAGQEMRDHELAHLDWLARKTQEVLARIHLAYNNSGVIVHQGEVLQDDGPTLAAIKLLDQLSVSRRRLLGLDAETKVAVSGKVTYQVVGVDPAGIADAEPEPPEPPPPT